MQVAQFSGSVSTHRAEIKTISPVLVLGQLVGTRAFVDLFPNEILRTNAVHLVMQKYHYGDWGDVSKRSKIANDEALDIDNPGRILGKYNIRSQAGRYVDIFVMTEWNRSVTTLMLPSDY